MQTYIKRKIAQKVNGKIFLPGLPGFFLGLILLLKHTILCKRHYPGGF
jgi:hypothetical protein